MLEVPDTLGRATPSAIGLELPGEPLRLLPGGPTLEKMLDRGRCEDGEARLLAPGIADAVIVLMLDAVKRLVDESIERAKQRQRDPGTERSSRQPTDRELP